MVVIRERLGVFRHQELSPVLDLILCTHVKWIAFERRRLLQDLKKNEEEWMAFEAQLQAERAGVLSPEAAARREELFRAGRELLGRLGEMLALPRSGLA